MKISRLSASRLTLFQDCAYHYRLRYHDKVPSDKISPAAEYGRWLHKGFELSVKDNRPVEEVLKETINDYSFGDDHLRKTPKILENFKRFNDGLETGKTEFEFKVDPGGEVPLMGIIDRLIVKDDSAVIVDYKTGRFRKSARELKSDSQLAMYVYAAHELTGLPFHKIEAWLFYVFWGKVMKVTFTSQEIDKFLEMSRKAISTIIKMEPEAAKPKINKFCGWCEYSEMCKAYQKYKILRRIK